MGTRCPLIRLFDYLQNRPVLLDSSHQLYTVARSSHPRRSPCVRGNRTISASYQCHQMYFCSSHLPPYRAIVQNPSTHIPRDGLHSHPIQTKILAAKRDNTPPPH